MKGAVLNTAVLTWRLPWGSRGSRLGRHLEGQRQHCPGGGPPGRPRVTKTRLLTWPCRFRPPGVSLQSSRGLQRHERTDSHDVLTNGGRPSGRPRIATSRGATQLQSASPDGRSPERPRVATAPKLKNWEERFLCWRVPMRVTENHNHTMPFGLPPRWRTGSRPSGRPRAATSSRTSTLATSPMAVALLGDRGSQHQHPDGRRRQVRGGGCPAGQPSIATTSTLRSSGSWVRLSSGATEDRNVETVTDKEIVKACGGSSFGRPRIATPQSTSRLTTCTEQRSFLGVAEDRNQVTDTARMFGVSPFQLAALASRLG
jgi:hypothetical protein